MSDKTVSVENVQKALGALKDLSKGLKGEGGGVTTAVSGTASGVGSPTQINHTPNSAVSSHAGTTVESPGFVSELAPNGTDVGGAVRKSVLEMVAKGTITIDQADEILKGLPPFMKKDEDKGEDKKDEKKDGKKDKKKDDDKDDDKVEKSLETLAEETLEVSDFLSDLVTTLVKSLAGVEERVVSRVVSQLSASNSKQEQFNKSLAGAISTLGEGLVATSGRVAEVEKAPAHAPKSHVTGYLAKSFGGEEVNLSKKEILNTMDDMLHKSLMNPQAILKFDSVGEISEDVLQSVVAYRTGK